MMLWKTTDIITMIREHVIFDQNCHQIENMHTIQNTQKIWLHAFRAFELRILISYWQNHTVIWYSHTFEIMNHTVNFSAGANHDLFLSHIFWIFTLFLTLCFFTVLVFKLFCELCLFVHVHHIKRWFSC